jgi:DNA-binding beta-propeller fold protein YncE
MNKNKQKSLSRIYFLLLSCFFLLGSTASFALPFNVAPKAGTSLPTTVLQGGTVTAYYTVTNNTQAQRNNNYVKYLPPNVTQVTSGGTYPDTCGATFNLVKTGGAGDSCTLQLTISGPVDGNDPDSHHHLFVCFPGGVTCAGTNSPLNVTVSTPLKFTVGGTVSGLNAGNSLVLQDNGGDTLTVSANGSFTFPTALANGATYAVTILTQPTGQTCTVTNGNGIINNTNVINVTISCSSSSSRASLFAYVTNADLGNSSVSYCPINSDGSFGACNTTGNGFSTPDGITINPTGSFAYVTNATNNTVSYCPINSNGTFGTCTSTGNGFSNPAGIAISPTGNFAYVANHNNSTVSYCPINSNGTFGTCSTTGIGFVVPDGIAINPAGSFAYVTDQNLNTVFYCSINSNGSFGTCTPTGSGFNAPAGIAINPAGTFAYVTSQNNSTVFYCPINSNGSFGTCTATGSGIAFPVGIAINVAGTIAYIVNANSSTALYCPINSNGSLGACTTTGNGFFASGIAV